MGSIKSDKAKWFNPLVLEECNCPLTLFCCVDYDKVKHRAYASRNCQVILIELPEVCQPSVDARQQPLVLILDQHITDKTSPQVALLGQIR